MEKKTYHIRSKLLDFHIYSDNLPRRKTDYGSLLIIIFAAPVFQSTISPVLKEKRINSVGHHDMIDGFRCLFEIHDRYQRMLGLDAEQFIIVVNR